MSLTKIVSRVSHHQSLRARHSESLLSTPTSLSTLREVSGKKLMQASQEGHAITSTRHRHNHRASHMAMRSPACRKGFEKLLLPAVVRVLHRLIPSSECLAPSAVSSAVTNFRRSPAHWSLSTAVLKKQHERTETALSHLWPHPIVSSRDNLCKPSCETGAPTSNSVSHARLS